MQRTGLTHIKDTLVIFQYLVTRQHIGGLLFIGEATSGARFDRQ